MSPFVAIDFTGMKEYATTTTSKNHTEKEIFSLYFMP